MTPSDFGNTISKELQQLHILPQRIAVALSGGSDSLSLTLALHNIKYDVLAILVNHHLRQEADREIQQTIQTLKTFNIKYIVKDWDGNYTNNLEAEARNARYKLLLETCKIEKIKILCIGHHADDQIETFFLNLARGSGLDGLCAMPKIMTIDGIQIVRPMLSLTKQDGREYLKSFNIQWCEDKSNNDTKYKRNKIRFLLNEIENKELITKRILTTIKTMQEARQTLDALVLGAEKNLIHYTTNGAFFDKREFLLSTIYLQKSVLVKCITKLANKEYKPRLYQIENIITSIKTETKFKRTIANLIISCKQNTIKIEKQEQL